jgi:hypothetical protein
VSAKRTAARPPAPAPAPLPLRLARRFARWWFSPDVPAERLAGVRILVGLFAVYYLRDRFGSIMAVSRLPEHNWKPIGAVALVVDRPLDPATLKTVIIATQIAAIGFLTGICYRVVAPVFAALLLFTLTYRNSWTMVFHTENLLVLQVIALSLAPAAHAWSIDRWWRNRRGAPPPVADGQFAWGVRLAAVLTVTTYVLAGIAKLRLTGIDWLDGDQLRNQIAFDNLRKALLGDNVAEAAVPLLEHPALFIPLSIMTVLIECGAPIALLGGRIAALWAVTAWGFHVGVIVLMGIIFPYPLSGVAYAPLFRVERPMGWIARRLGRLVAPIERRIPWPKPKSAAKPAAT